MSKPQLMHWAVMLMMFTWELRNPIAWFEHYPVILTPFVVFLTLLLNFCFLSLAPLYLYFIFGILLHSAANNPNTTLLTATIDVITITK